MSLRKYRLSSLADKIELTNEELKEEIEKVKEVTKTVKNKVGKKKK